MKKFLRLLSLSLGGVALIVVGGCHIGGTKSDGEDETLESVFSRFFTQPDEAMGELISAPFMFMDSIKNVAGGVEKLTYGSNVETEQVTLTWLAATNYWYCTAVIIEKTDTIKLTDSIQFKYLNGPVQYPLNNDSLTQIISYATMVVTATGIDTAYGFQNMIFTHNPNTGILVLDGTGSSRALIAENDCQVEWDFEQIFTDVTWNSAYLVDEVTGDLYCPYDGVINYNGSFNAGCFGSDIEIVGDWAVSETFDYGDITYAITQDSSWFTYYDTCETGFSEVMSQADTTFVETMFSYGAPTHFLDGYEMAFALMIEQGLMDTLFSPEKNRFGESALQDTAIVTMISEYVNTNGWHVFLFEAIAIDNMDTIVVTGIDSLKGVLGGSPVNTIADIMDLDELLHRAHYNVSASGAEGLVTGSMHHNMVATINNTGADTTVTFYGHLWDSLMVVSGAGITGFCEVDLTLHQIIDYLVLELEVDGDCPMSGEVTSDFHLDIACDSGDGLNVFLVNGGWTLTATANGNGIVTTIYENVAGTLSWPRTGDCVNMSPSTLLIGRARQ